MYIVIAGNVIDGLIHYGPFTVNKHAHEYAEINIKNDNWIVCKLVDARGVAFDIPNISKHKDDNDNISYSIAYNDGYISSYSVQQLLVTHYQEYYGESTQY